MFMPTVWQVDAHLPQQHSIHNRQGSARLHKVKVTPSLGRRLPTTSTGAAAWPELWLQRLWVCWLLNMHSVRSLLHLGHRCTTATDRVGSPHVGPGQHGQGPAVHSNVLRIRCASASLQPT